VQDVDQDDLETVVSKKVGTSVMILRGEHAGQRARLLQKLPESAAVQLAESREAVSLGLDDVADFRGADSDDW
jgi:hypothetical protein